jgi:hypothetical protein
MDIHLWAWVVKIVYETLDLFSKAGLEVEDLAAINLLQLSLAEIGANHDARVVPTTFECSPCRLSIDENDLVVDDIMGTQSTIV